MSGKLCNVQLYDANYQHSPSTVIFGGVDWLTTKTKRKMLSDLRKEIALKRVDRHMIPYLRRINAIKGVCTQFCCMGHPSEARKNTLPTSGNLLFFVDIFMHRALLNNWATISEWPECTEVATGHYDDKMRWMFHWKCNKHKSFYKEFLDKLIPALKKWRREEIEFCKEFKRSIGIIHELKPNDESRQTQTSPQ